LGGFRHIQGTERVLLLSLNAAASRASPTQPDSQPVDLGEFEQSLEDVEQLLVALKQRYTQVQQDLRRQAELQSALYKWGKNCVKDADYSKSKRQIKEQLEAIEINLESQFSWAASKNLFGKLFGLED